MCEVGIANWYYLPVYTVVVTVVAFTYGIVNSLVLLESRYRGRHVMTLSENGIRFRINQSRIQHFRPLPCAVVVAILQTNKRNKYHRYCCPIFK